MCKYYVFLKIESNMLFNIKLLSFITNLINFNIILYSKNNFILNKILSILEFKKNAKVLHPKIVLNIYCIALDIFL